MASREKSCPESVLLIGMWLPADDRIPSGSVLSRVERVSKINWLHTNDRLPSSGALPARGLLTSSDRQTKV